MGSINTMIPPEFTELPFSEKLLLWGMRQWKQAYVEGQNGHDFIRTGFKLAGISAAHPALDDVMSVLVSRDCHLVDIRAPQCPDISYGEHRLLGAIAAWQQGACARKVDLYLACWLPMAMLKIIHHPLCRLADVLSNVGLYVRVRPGVAASEHHLQTSRETRSRPTVSPVNLH